MNGWSVKKGGLGNDLGGLAIIREYITIWCSCINGWQLYYKSMLICICDSTFINQVNIYLAKFLSCITSAACKYPSGSQSISRNVFFISVLQTYWFFHYKMFSGIYLAY